MSSKRDRPMLPVLAAVCACDGSTLEKLLQPALLAALATGQTHGYALAERLGTSRLFGGHKPDVSGIYRMLKGMEEQGLVAAAWDTSAAGPARKCYRITPAGRDCLRHWIHTLENYRQGVSDLLRAARRVVERQPSLARDTS